MPNNFELSLKSIPICTTEMLAIVVDHVANANELLRQEQYDEAHVEISIAQHTMIELDTIENILGDRLSCNESPGTNNDIIERQNIRISELENHIDLLQNEIFELRKGKDSQKVISELMAQVMTLKKIAKCERAQRLRDLADYETDDTMMPYFYEDARRMLAMEHPEVDWR